MGSPDRLSGFLGEWPPVPDCNDPYRFSVQLVEKPIRGHNGFPKRKIGKLRQMPSRFWIALKPS